jgi:hypothetical protein
MHQEKQHTTKEAAIRKLSLALSNEARENAAQSLLDHATLYPQQALTERIRRPSFPAQEGWRTPTKTSENKERCLVM